MKLLLPVVLAWAAWLPMSCNAEWKGFSLPEYSNPVSAIHPLGVREFVNGQWLTGYGKDLAYYQIPGTLNGKPLPKLYLALDHLFNADELLAAPGKARGVFGPAIGTEIGGLASKVQGAANFAINFVHETGGPVIQAPPWLTEQLDNWLTVEAGGGYRLFGNMPDVKPWSAWVGGRVRIQFDLGVHH